MRILGLDLGTKSLGIAVSDDTNTFALPLKTIKFNSFKESLDEVLKIIEEKNIGLIVLGLPKNMNASLGEAAQRSIEYKNFLEKETNIKIVLEDERLSTVEAERFLLNEDMSRKKRKKYIDSVAASVILDTYLKKRRDKDAE